MATSCLRMTTPRTLKPQRAAILLQLLKSARRHVALSPSANVAMSPCTNVSVSPCANVSVSPCANVALSPCANVSVSPCANVSVSPCANVSVSPCANVSVSPCANMGMSTSAHMGVSISAGLPFNSPAFFMMKDNSSDHLQGKAVAEDLSSKLGKAAVPNTVPSKEPPHEPLAICCMQGCFDCDWLMYIDELMVYYSDDVEKVREVLESIEDPNLREFLLMELGE